MKILCLSSVLVSHCMHKCVYVCVLVKVWMKNCGGIVADHPWFTKLRPFKLVLTINSISADLFICQTVFGY